MINEQNRDPNKTTRYIMFLVKFFERREYANDFLSGRLYANRLSYFKNIEGAGDTNRGDKYEGTVVWGQPGRIQIKINEHDISNDLAGPASMSLHRLEHFNVLCFYAGYIRNYNSQLTEAEIKNQLIIPRQCDKFGQYAVVIKDGAEFFKRVKQATNARDYREAHGIVKYYDPDTFHGNFPGISGAFRKQERFSYEQEYRIVIETGIAGTWPLVLDIGDISDITMPSSIQEINQNLQVIDRSGIQ